MRYDVMAQDTRESPLRFVGSRQKRAEAVALVDGLVNKSGLFAANLVTEKGNVTYRRSNRTYPIANRGYTILVKRDYGYLLIVSGGAVREFFPPSDEAFATLVKRHRHNAAPNGLPWLFHHALTIREINERLKGTL